MDTLVPLDSFDSLFQKKKLRATPREKKKGKKKTVRPEDASEDTVLKPWFEVAKF